ncbi:hypothetical protein [Bradyrhizobium japonicum]|uniref:hypothetical protein n=1 Tax=Bradyrhizobium japonicum TaxID=375 RepID=UPI00047FEA09|nr:hypothetical protein [Bradyrhizobium japonicum]
MPFLGLRVGVPDSSLVSADAYASYLLYDDFSGTVAAVSGRVPQKGAAWTASGASAGVMVAGGGQLKQTNDTPAAYAFNQLSQNPGKLVGKWQNDNGASGAVPTIAICPSTVLTSGVVLHGELGTTSPFFRAIDNGTFKVPAWSVAGSSYVLEADVEYTTELYWDDKFARIKVYNGASLIGEQLVYEPLLASGGGQEVFFETLDSHLAYTLATAEAKPASGYTWPTLNILAEQSIPTTATASATVFGGSVTNNAAGLIISGASYGQGAYAFDLGSAVIGDKFSVSFDVANLSAGGWEAALLATGAFEAEKSNLLLFNANGRVQGIITATAAGSMSLFIGVDSSGVGGNITISNLTIIKNPPTTP